MISNNSIAQYFFIIIYIYIILKNFILNPRIYIINYTICSLKKLCQCSSLTSSAEDSEQVEVCHIHLLASTVRQIYCNRKKRISLMRHACTRFRWKGQWMSARLLRHPLYTPTIRAGII